MTGSTRILGRVQPHLIRMTRNTKKNIKMYRYRRKKGKELSSVSTIILNFHFRFYSNRFWCTSLAKHTHDSCRRRRTFFSPLAFAITSDWIASKLLSCLLFESHPYGLVFFWLNTAAAHFTVHTVSYVFGVAHRFGLSLNEKLNGTQRFVLHRCWGRFSGM